MGELAYDMYQEIILQHYRHPKNFGPMEAPDREGAESNPLCGDHIELRLRLGADGGTIEDARFTGDGCAISMAAASMLTQRLKGLPIPAASALSRDDILTMIGIPLSPVRIKCALTPFVAFGHALHPSGPGANTPPSPPESSGSRPA